MCKLVGKGKVRETYDVGDGTLVIVTTDRISAYDYVLPTTIPDKGVLLNKLSAFWFDFTKDIIPNHLISIYNAHMPKEFQTSKFAGRCMLVRKLQMLPVECIVRGYISGSGWSSYQKTGLVCGIKLPEGLRESEKLPIPIYTPSTKATKGHDENIPFEKTFDLVGEAIATQLRDISIKLYSKCAEYALTKGIIIADTKFEFGLDEDGNIVLGDEMLTPDSSCFWPLSDYGIGRSIDSYDKQLVIDYLGYQSGWDKNSNPPKLNDYIVYYTRENYIRAHRILTGTWFFSE